MNDSFEVYWAENDHKVWGYKMAFLISLYLSLQEWWSFLHKMIFLHNFDVWECIMIFVFYFSDLRDDLKLSEESDDEQKIEPIDSSNLTVGKWVPCDKIYNFNISQNLNLQKTFNWTFKSTFCVRGVSHKLYNILEFRYDPHYFLWVYRVCRAQNMFRHNLFPLH